MQVGLKIVLQNLNFTQMKKIHFILIIILALTLQSCRLWERVFPPKYGCTTNGKNVGAEQLLEPAKKGKKAKKTPKFKA
jgi:hypothetical protein